ncbi:hypothetical protein ABZ299_26280 [Streptomyces sp. NPDC006184]|uniref:hypothetical protein n=1 Tax=unclassified Streptomyces TaxID=2593676 RepID=UPI0033A08547
MITDSTSTPAASATLSRSAGATAISLDAPARRWRMLAVTWSGPPTNASARS